MKKKIKYLIFSFLVVLALHSWAQVQNSKWCFGFHAGLDFIPNPPAGITNNTMVSILGSSSISDATGSLLFCTNGDKIWNKQNLVMANGTGILGNDAGYQSSLIVRKPGSSSLYYLFTVMPDYRANGFSYSVIDMTLASGQGSVTLKNVPLYPDSCYEPVVGTMHCNGSDVWIVIRQYGTDTYRSYLLTSAGVNNTPVISTTSLQKPAYWGGAMKLSPTGKKLGVTNYYGPSNVAAELLDFDKVTGIVSNSLALYANLGSFSSTYLAACEFSPDGTKFYACGYNIVANNKIYQWDLCGGSNAAITASKDSIAVPPATYGSMQLGPNGKIYITGNNLSTLSVINNPNASAAACNFAYLSQPISGVCRFGLPSLITRYQPVLAPFSYSLVSGMSCRLVSFTAAPNPTISCVAMPDYSITGISWNFNDPTSAANTSTLQQPIHLYTASGTFTPMQIFHYVCGSDTVRQVINVPRPDILLSLGQATCNTPVSTTITAIGGTGPYSYTWMPSSQTGSVVNLSAGSHSILILDAGQGCSVQTMVIIPQAPAPTLTLSPASIASLCAGSGLTLSVNGTGNGFTWSPSQGLNTASGNSVIASPQTTQTYVVSSSLNFCSTFASITVSVLPLPTTLITGKTKLCVNDSLRLKGSGGSQYNWQSPNGYSGTEPDFNMRIEGLTAGGLYSLTVTDANGCKNNATVFITLNNAPQGKLLGTSVGCAPLCSVYSFEADNSPATITSSWSLENQFFANTFSYCFPVPGAYMISGTIYDSLTTCSNKTVLQVNVYPKPKAGFQYIPVSPVESLDEVVFTNTSQGNEKGQCSWFFNNDADYKTNGERATYTYSNAGIYPVALVITNTWNCSDSLVQLVKVEPDFHIYVPNAFTPDANDLNEIFMPITRGVASYNLEVFDRWGKRVFTSDDSAKGWDGTFKGQPCKEDTYVWKLNVASAADEVKQLSGHITLLR